MRRAHAPVLVVRVVQVGVTVGEVAVARAAVRAHEGVGAGAGVAAHIFIALQLYRKGGVRLGYLPRTLQKRRH